MRCKLCNSQHISSFTCGKPEKRYHHCHDCDLVFMDDDFLISRQEENQRYDHHNNTPEDERYVAYFNRFLDAIWDPLMKEKQEITTALDFGCGQSHLLADLLSEKGIQTTYYDLYYYPDEEKLNQQYDLITSTEVFEHLGHPKETIKKLLNSLVKGGFLAVMTQVHHGDENEFAKWWYRKDETHIIFFSRKTILALCKLFNLKLIFFDEKSRFILQKI